MRTTPGRKVKARTQNSLLIRKVEIQSRLKINLSNNLKMKSEGSVRKGKVKTLLRQPMLIKNRRKILFKILLVEGKQVKKQQVAQQWFLILWPVAIL